MSEVLSRLPEIPGFWIFIPLFLAVYVGLALMGRPLQSFLFALALFGLSLLGVAVVDTTLVWLTDANVLWPWSGSFKARALREFAPVWLGLSLGCSAGVGLLKLRALFVGNRLRKWLEPQVEEIRNEEGWKLETLERLAKDDPTLLPLLRQLELNVMRREEIMREMGIPAEELPSSARFTPPKGME
jgi:hypothetical protein